MLSRAWYAIMQAAIRDGSPQPLQEVYTFHVAHEDDAEAWKITINGTKEDTAEGLPPFHVAVSWYGWPAGILGPAGGVLAAGRAANEAALIADLEAHRAGEAACSP